MSNSLPTSLEYTRDVMFTSDGDGTFGTCSFDQYQGSVQPYNAVKPQQSAQQQQQAAKAAQAAQAAHAAQVAKRQADFGSCSDWKDTFTTAFAPSTVSAVSAVSASAASAASTAAVSSAVAAAAFKGDERGYNVPRGSSYASMY